MKPVFFRICLLICSLLIQNVFSQNYPNGLSDGQLEVNEKRIPVKIFATTSPKEFANFGDTPNENSVLVFLNEYVNSYSGTPFFQGFIANGYTFLDEDFQPISSDNPISPKYLYKSSAPENVIKQGDNVKLDTKFTIWNPSKGINIFGFTLHFYSLMFVLAFGLGYVIMSRMFRIDGVDAKYLEPLFTWTLVGTIFGARLGHVIFYQPELFKEDFWSVFLPIQTKPEFRFTGFSGLASHGASIALIGTTLYYSLKIIKKNPFWVYDRLGIVVALAGVFIRMGNFFNSEIIGKPVAADSPFAILFPQMSGEYGLTVPRYPTQLFEAFGYLLLFILLWCLYRYSNRKYQQGWLFGLFFLVLWSIRFFVEFFKEPQGDEFIQFAGLNTGQILSLPFILAGLVIMIYSKKIKISPSEQPTAG